MAAPTKRTTATKRNTTTTRQAVKAKQPANAPRKPTTRKTTPRKPPPPPEDPRHEPEPGSLVVELGGHEYQLRDDLTPDMMSLMTVTAIDTPSGDWKTHLRIAGWLKGLFVPDAWMQLVEDTLAAGHDGIKMRDVLPEVTNAVGVAADVPFE